MTTKTNNEDAQFRSRKDFKTFISEDAEFLLEETLGSKVQILSVSEQFTDEQPDILAVMNIHEKTYAHLQREAVIWRSYRLPTATWNG